MKGLKAFSLSLAVIFYILSLKAWACTSFNLEGTGYNLFGKNYDWTYENAVLIANKRGQLKLAMRTSDNEGDLLGKPARWISKYGSITFNQYGRELPQGGMNEKGLVVEGMSLSNSIYPKPDSRPFIHRNQWIQYQLDNHSSVDEVIQSNSKVRILPTSKGIGSHFLISDKTGKCVIIEFLDGKMVFYTGAQVQVRALSNEVYADSVESWKQSDGTNPPNRFVIAGHLMNKFNQIDQATSLKEAFEILNKISQGNSTKWSIVYDIINSRISYRTHSNRSIRYLDLKRFDFSCKTPVQVLDINRIKIGDVTDKFYKYSPDLNRELIIESFKAAHKEECRTACFLNLLDKIAAYPNSIICQQSDQIYSQWHSE